VSQSSSEFFKDLAHEIEYLRVYDFNLPTKNVPRRVSKGFSTRRILAAAKPLLARICQTNAVMHAVVLAKSHILGLLTYGKRASSKK